MKCNLCLSEDNKIIYKYTRFERNNILKCERCGLVFLETKKTKKEMESFYIKEYRKVKDLPRQTPEEIFNSSLVRHDCEERIGWIKRNYGGLEKKRVIEIGSSAGYFLNVLSLNGAEAVGLELTESYSNYARNLGFTVYSKPFGEMDFREEFDLVVMFHTLEHIFDPMSILQAIYRSLNKGGVFMGEVSNQNDWRIGIFDNEIVKRFHYDPYHPYYFSSETLNKYLKKCDFDDVKLETVERYNSLVQLRRILSGEYDQENINSILRRDIFAKPKEDVRIPNPNNFQENNFNRIFGKAVNSELMGNCLRWTAQKKL